MYALVTGTGYDAVAASALAVVAVGDGGGWSCWYGVGVGLVWVGLVRYFFVFCWTDRGMDACRVGRVSVEPRRRSVWRSFEGHGYLRFMDHSEFHCFRQAHLVRGPAESTSRAAEQ